MESITRFITQKLQLKVNETKSAVARPQERKLLGFSFSAGPEIKRTIAPKALERFKHRVREITRRAKGVSLETTIAELASYMRARTGAGSKPGYRNRSTKISTIRIRFFTMTRYLFRFAP